MTQEFQNTNSFMTALCGVVFSILCSGATVAQQENVMYPMQFAGEPAVVTDSNYGSGSDVAQQISQMQSQLQRQHYELSALRTQLEGNPSIIDERRSYYFANYESVLLQPVQSNNSALIVETATGFSHVPFAWTLGYSPRVQFGRESTSDNLGWRVRFWDFRKSNSIVANATTGIIPTGREGTVGFLSEDGDITTGLDFIESGTFTSKMRVDVLDWEVQKQASNGVDIYAGLRYAKLAQSYFAATDQGNASSGSEFRGLGPTANVRFTHLIPSRRVYLFSNLRGSLLFGHKDFSAFDDVNNIRQDIGLIKTRNFKDGVDTVVSNMEVQLGIRVVPRDWVAFTVALEGQHFANVGGPNPTAVFIGPDSGLSGDSPLDDSLSFIGLNIGSEMLW